MPPPAATAARASHPPRTWSKEARARRAPATRSCGGPLAPLPGGRLPSEAGPPADAPLSPPALLRADDGCLVLEKGDSEPAPIPHRGMGKADDKPAAISFHHHPLSLRRLERGWGELRLEEAHRSRLRRSA